MTVFFRQKWPDRRIEPIRPVGGGDELEVVLRDQVELPVGVTRVTGGALMFLYLRTVEVEQCFAHVVAEGDEGMGFLRLTVERDVKESQGHGVSFVMWAVRGVVA
jgi:hypothetical protein